MPTLGFVSNDVDPDKRIDIQVKLAENPDTRPDVVPIDMGSMNYELYHSETKSFEYVDRIYIIPPTYVSAPPKNFKMQAWA